MEIEPIRIPTNVIREIPPPVVDRTPPPVVSGVEVPVIDLPSAAVDYPVIDVPTQQEFEGMMIQQGQNEPETPTDTRDLPPPPAQVNLPVVGPVDLPPVAPLITAGATAVVTTGAALGATIVFGQAKQAAEPFIRSTIERLTKNKKVKIKQQKPVLHFVKSDEGVTLFEYSTKGTRLVESTQDIEKYLRDNVETDSLYEYDNKLILDDNIKELFTKEGQKRFKRHFVPSKKIVKMLSARFSI